MIPAEHREGKRDIFMAARSRSHLSQKDIKPRYVELIMEWITVHHRRETRKTPRSHPPSPTETLPSTMTTAAPPALRLDPSVVQRFIRRRIGLSISQDSADIICGFAPHTVNAIESHQLYPTVDQLVAFDAHLTVLEGRQERE